MGGREEENGDGGVGDMGIKGGGPRGGGMGRIESGRGR